MRRRVKSEESRRRLGLVIAVTALLGCEPRPPGSSEPPPSRDPEAGTSSAELECEAQNYPCRWSDVDPEVVRQSAATLRDGALMLEEGMAIADIASALEARAEVVSVVATETALRFRVEGGRGLWIAAVEAVPSGLRGIPSLPAAVYSTHAQAQERDGRVAGPVERFGERPEKTALVLAPFQWELGPFDAGAVLYHTLRTKDYRCRNPELTDRGIVFTYWLGCDRPTVDYFYNDFKRDGSVTDPCVKNELGKCSEIEFQVGVESFKGWQEYEIVHVATHGLSICHTDNRSLRWTMKGDCVTALATGTMASYETTRSEFAGREGRPAAWGEVGVEYMYAKPPRMCGRLKGQALTGNEAAADQGKRDPFAGDMWYQAFPAWAEDLMNADYSREKFAGQDAQGNDLFSFEWSDEAIEQMCPESPPILTGLQNELTDPAGLWMWELVTDEFFKNTYEDGLTDKVVFLAACESLGNSGLAEHLAANGSSTVLGWSLPVFNSVMAWVADAFYAALLSPCTQDSCGPDPGGLRAEEAYEEVKKLAQSALSPMTSESFQLRGPTLAYVPSDSELLSKGHRTKRAREIITLLDPSTREELQDGAIVVANGTPGDGRSDKIELLFQVDGIGDDQSPGDFELHLVTNGVESDLRERLTRADLMGTVARRLVEVDLGVDLPEDGTFDLEPWVELPDDGGISRWLYEDLRVAAWRLTIGGGRFGGSHYGGEAYARGGIAVWEGMPDNALQRAEELGHGARSFEFKVAPDADLQMLVALQVGDDGSGTGVLEPGTYEVGFPNFQVVFENDRFLRGDFAAETNADLHREYQTGDGRSDEIGTFPSPALLEVTEVSGDLIVGRLQGNLWTFDRGAPDYITVPFSLEFRAKRCLFGGAECRPLPPGG